MNVKTFLTEKLIQTFKNLGYDADDVRVAFSDMDGVDLQCNSAFLLAKKYHDNPLNIANRIQKEFDNSNNFFAVSVAGAGFINFTATDLLLNRIANDVVMDDRIGVPRIEFPLSVFFDYGGANIAKPLHVGHLRSAIIGQALYNLNKFLGNKVVGDVHLGDWGLQMGLTIAELMDKNDLSAYFDESINRPPITEEMLDTAYPNANARKKVDEEFANRASDITLKIQQKERGYYDIWREMRKVCINFLKRTYSSLDVDFDLWLGESSVNDLVPKVIQIFVDKGLAQKSDGALVVDVKRDDDTKPMPPAIIQKSNGAQMYIITDIATLVDRLNKYTLDRVVYVTDSRQQLHFEQWFRCVRLAELAPKNLQLVHVGYGTINGTDGKPFKTRDGGVQRLDNLINSAIETAYAKLIENGVDDRNTAKQIALSAIKFGDFINYVGKDYVFDFDKFLKFEGKTGPYVQYTGVRIKSILNKSKLNNYKVCVKTDEERKVVSSLIRLIDSFEVAYRENSLNTLCQCAYDLASTYSNLYNNIKILGEEDEQRRNALVSISYVVLKAITCAFEILGIEIPERM